MYNGGFLFLLLSTFINLIYFVKKSLPSSFPFLTCFQCGVMNSLSALSRLSFISVLRLSCIWLLILGLCGCSKAEHTPLQYSCLENPMDGGAWEAVVHGVAKSRTRLSDFTFTFPFHALEKEMATHSSVLAWRIPRTGEPGGLPSVGSHRVGHE